jgi:hypothetical protein
MLSVLAPGSLRRDSTGRFGAPCDSNRAQLVGPAETAANRLPVKKKQKTAGSGNPHEALQK